MLRLTLELDPDTSPLRGCVVEEDRTRVPFTGMLELLSALEAAIAGGIRADPVPERP